MLCPKLLIGGATVEIHFHIIVPIFGENKARSKLVNDLSIVTDIFAHLQKHVRVKLGYEVKRRRASIWILGFGSGNRVFVVGIWVGGSLFVFVCTYLYTLCSCF
jgi:hypothetical protein